MIHLTPLEQLTQQIEDLKHLIQKGHIFIQKCSSEKLSAKPAENKWSKKGILGHLIDSGINNLQRFTEIQFTDKPYPLRKYRQDELVKANDYQHAEPEELLSLWKSINQRIIKILETQKKETLEYLILLEDNNTANLSFLIEDYVSHMRHHLKQIVD